jgi:hypothetical protein
MQGDPLISFTQKYSYLSGQLNFFNCRRKEGIIGEILSFLSLKEKFSTMNVCRNIFAGVKRQIDFNV